MIIGILEARLQHVVVHITDRQLCLQPGDSHRLKLQVRHGSRGILSQRLVYSDADLFTGYQLPIHQMPFQNLLHTALSNRIAVVGEE